MIKKKRCGCCPKGIKKDGVTVSKRYTFTLPYSYTSSLFIYISIYVGIYIYIYIRLRIGKKVLRFGFGLV